LVPILWLGVGTQAAAQRVQAPHFDSYVAWPRVEEDNLGLIRNGQRQGARASKGHSALVGAMIGAGVGLLGGAVYYAFCKDPDNGNTGSCLGEAGLAFGANVGFGAFIGYLVGGE
jgi:hypothetical protein